MECHSCLDQGLLFFSSKAKINQLKIFLHDLIDRETRDGPRPGSACLCPHNHLRPGQGCVTFITAPHYLASLPRYIRLDSSGSSTIFTITLWIYWEISVEVKVNLMNDVMKILIKEIWKVTGLNMNQRRLTMYSKSERVNHTLSEWRSPFDIIITTTLLHRRNEPSLRLGLSRLW